MVLMMMYMTRVLNKYPCIMGQKFNIRKVKGRLSTVMRLSTSFVDTDHPPEYRKKMWKHLKKNDPEMDYFIGSTAVQNKINDLSNIMKCSVEQATELMKRNSTLGVIADDKLHSRIQLLMSSKFSATDILANPSVLHRTNKVLEYRLAMLKQLKSTPNEMSLSILKKSDRGFDTCVRKQLEEEKLSNAFSTRQALVENILECSKEKAESLITEYDLNSISAHLFKSKVELLKYYEISSEQIVANLLRMLVNTSITVLKSRLELLKDNGLLDIPHLKLSYLLSGNMVDFEKSFTILKNNNEALEGYRNKKEYLIFRLKCSEKVAEGLIENKPINSMSELKLKGMLDFFLNEMEVSSDFVICNMYLLGYSLERMQSRWPVIRSSVSWNVNKFPRLLSMSDESFATTIKDNNKS